MPAAPLQADRIKTIRSAVLDTERDRNTHRCYTCTGTSDAWEALAHKLVVAYIDTTLTEAPGGYTGGGAMHPKTKKRMEQEWAVFEALAAVASDFPGQPLGMTTSAVLLTLRDLDPKGK